MANAEIVELVNAFYATWRHGSASLDEARLRDIVALDVEFDGPLAGHVSGADGYLAGLLRFVRGVKAQRILQVIHTANDAAVLYECDMDAPNGTFQFVEFLHFEHGKIKKDTLVFDTAELRKLRPPLDRE